MDISHNSNFFNIQIQLIACPFGVMDSLGEQGARGAYFTTRFVQSHVQMYPLHGLTTAALNLLIGMKQH